MGISIRAVGEASKANIEGMDTNCVEALLRARSVDFVTYAGAGGQVEAMESAQNRDNDVDLVESSARKETTNVKTLEQHRRNASSTR
ncbi:MAG: hypothetical protein DMG75_04445 [Acidobacteria bacterium]|nr:MAG: hypothetical protein DMG75_04445 [Acidobacteriota bacterium]